MSETLPAWVYIIFLLTTGATILLFYFANGKRKWLLFFLLFWSVIQSILAYEGFYLDSNTFPPPFILVLLPLPFSLF